MSEDIEWYCNDGPYSGFHCEIYDEPCNEASKICGGLCAFCLSCIKVVKDD